jgi:hypothetical protein
MKASAAWKNEERPTSTGRSACATLAGLKPGAYNRKREAHGPFESLGLECKYEDL